jgi:hypothetical protein
VLDRLAPCVALAGLLAAAACTPERHLLGLVETADASGGAGGTGGPGGAGGAVLDAAVGGEDGGADVADASEPDAGPTPTVGELWTEFVNVTCRKMQVCCTDDEKLRNTLASSLSFCVGDLTNVRTLLSSLQAERVVQSAQGGRAVYRPEHVAACLAGLEALDCTAARTRRELACEEVLEPRVPVGGACAVSSHYECIDGYCAAGTCAGRKPDGQACYEDQECLSRYCTGGGKGGLCSSPVGRPDDLCAP